MPESRQIARVGSLGPAEVAPAERSAAKGSSKRGTGMHNESTPETLPQTIFGILQSLQRAAALTTAVQLDLFTAIGEGGASPDGIAAHCNASARGVRVLCDYLCVLGLLQKRRGRYWQTG